MPAKISEWRVLWGVPRTSRGCGRSRMHKSHGMDGAMSLRQCDCTVQFGCHLQAAGLRHSFAQTAQKASSAGKLALPQLGTRSCNYLEDFWSFG